MPPGRRPVEINPPAWWNLSLYDFLHELPPEGWVWEFMRRARLQEQLSDSPVDAMNPRPDLDKLGADYWNYYKRYNEIPRERLVFIPSSVTRPSDGWPRGFHGQQYRIHDEDLRYMKELLVDLNRPDSVILRDFKRLLSEFRESFPKPGRVSPRCREWAQSLTLPVWDLRQFGVTWQKIADDVFRHDNEVFVDTLRNAYKISQKYIDEGEWVCLARYVEPE